METGKKRSTVIIVVLVLLLCVVGGIAVYALTRDNTAPEEESDSAPKLGYAEGVTVVDDADRLQAAVDEMARLAKEGRIALSYQNDAYSEDGQTFTCYLANSPANLYDMYVQIFADAELTDQLYLSGLVRPGEMFEELTLDHPLTEDTRVYVVFTQVEETDGEQTIHAQTSFTMDFHVS